MLNGLIVIEPRHLQNVYGGTVSERLARRINWVAPPLSGPQLRQQPERLGNVDALFTGWGAPNLDADLLEHANALRVVFHAAGTVKGIVSPAFWERRIALTHAAVANAVPVVEYCTAMIVLALKRVFPLARHAQLCAQPGDKTKLRGAYGATVGLVSLGVIGQRMINALRAYDLRPIAYDPFFSPERAAALGVELVSLEEVFATSDVVSLHTPLLPETERLIRGRHVAAMKPHATLINSARGALIDEAELIEVLQQRPDLHAVLDVTYPEPPAPHSPLYHLPNVTLTPHVAGSQGLECQRMGLCMAEELERFVAGAPLQYAVDEARAAVLA